MNLRHIAASALMVPTMASAEFFDGNALLARILGNSTDQSLAIGYIMGVFDSTHSTFHCPPANVTSGQVRDMVQKTLSVNPEIRHMAADQIAMATFAVAWPCKNKPSSAPNLRQSAVRS